MLYSLTFNFDGIYGPGGAIGGDRSELLKHARDLAHTGVELLGDWIADAEWFDGSGKPAQLAEILNSDDNAELASALQQISDAMKSQRVGFIDIVEHDDLFALIDHHGMLEWLPEAMQERIHYVKRAYHLLASDISDKWSAA